MNDVYVPRLLKRYKEEVVPGLREQFGYKNDMAVPKLGKTVVNMGLGRAVQERKRLQDGMRDLAALTGQSPVVTRARKSVAGFKLRQGMEIGCKVTLRRARMYEFLDRLISIALPRIRDFRGLSPKGFDGRGNYSLGMSEQSAFPEVDLDAMEFMQGMNISIVTTARTDEEARSLLERLGMPFRK
jgi:large subunit ribosomal protein L5